MNAPREDLSLSYWLGLDIGLLVLLATALVLTWLAPLGFLTRPLLIVSGSLATLSVLVSAVKVLRTKSLSVEFLASIALVASVIEEEWVSVALIGLMIVSARIFSRYVTIRSHSAIAALLKIRPETAKIEKNGVLVLVPIATIKAGDLVVVELGDRVPVDGKIIKGSGAFDQASLTGESLPVNKTVGDGVFSSTIVAVGSFVVSAEKVGADTTFEKIIQLVGESQGNKARIHSLGDIFAKWYIWGTLALAIIIYLATRQMELVLALLLVSCADDIAVATPLALSSALVHASRHGVIIKGSDYLEGLAQVKVMLLDKTGTLTKGEFQVVSINSFGTLSEKELIGLAYRGTNFSHHPISEAVSLYAAAQKLSLVPSDQVTETSGEGIEVKTATGEILLGRRKFLEARQVKISPIDDVKIKAEENLGHSLILVSQNGELLGLIALADKLREGLPSMFKALRQAGIKHLIMLTGDNEKVAKEIASATGLTEYHANLLPADKLVYLKKYLNPKYKVAMVGDGVNDAPALTLADIGIAMGAIGSPAAIDSADIALMKDDLTQLPEMVRISHQTIGVIYQNIVIWGVVNALGLVLVFTHVLGPSGAAAYNFLTDFFPILNSLRLFRN